MVSLVYLHTLDYYKLILVKNDVFKLIIYLQEAKCLDGSPPSFYYKKGDSNNILINFQGGGWCSTPIEPFIMNDPHT